LYIESQQDKLPFFVPPDGHDDQQPLDPPLLLSSCFPYIGEVPLLPLPHLRLPLPEVEQQPASLAPYLPSGVAREDGALPPMKDTMPFW
jgi:hypothetical protein